MIQFLDLKREWNYFEAKFMERFKEFGRGGIYVLGPDVEIFERNFSAYCGYKYAIGVSSGLAALEVALLAHGIKPGDEVITVSNSAVATDLAISNVGAKPVFCDIGSDFLINGAKIGALITGKTKAILPVHLFGKICDITAINKIAQKHGLVVIEDACQAHGANFQGEAKKNTKAFSFYPTKNLGGLGEGGMVVTNNELVKDFAASYRNYGQKGRYNHEIRGNNYRLDPLQCVFLDIKLKELNEFVGKRRTIAKRYYASLKDVSGIEIGEYDESCSYHLFVVKIKDGRREAFIKYLKERNIETAIHYPVAIHKQPCFKKEYDGAVLPYTDKLQDEIVSLPCYHFLESSEQDLIIEEIKNFFS